MLSLVSASSSRWRSGQKKVKCRRDSTETACSHKGATVKSAAFVPSVLPSALLFGASLLTPPSPNESPVVAESPASLVQESEGVSGVLVWDAPQACPSEDVVAEMLRTKLSRPLWSVEDHVRLIMVVDDDQGIYTVRIWWVVAGEPIETRVVTGADCATVAELAAEIVALAATPALDAGPKRPVVGPPAVEPTCPPPDPAPPVAVSPATAPSASPTPKAHPALGLGAAVLGGATFGETPQTAAVLRARVSMLGRRFRGGLQAHYRFERRAPLSGGEGGVRVSAWTIGPRGCVTPRLGPVELPVCAEALLGQLRARPYGLEAPRRSQSLWATGGLGVGAWWPVLPGLALGGEALGFVAFRRPAFETQDGREIVRAAPAGFSVLIGAEGRFGRRWRRAARERVATAEAS